MVIVDEAALICPLDIFWMTRLSQSAIFLLSGSLLWIFPVLPA